MKTTIEDKYAVKLPVTRLQWQGQPGNEMVPSEFEEITVALRIWSALPASLWLSHYWITCNCNIQMWNWAK